MILYQGAFGLGDGLLNSMKLLSNVTAGSLSFDHPNHTQKMPVGTFQPFYNIRVGCMVGVFCHTQLISS